VVIAALVLGLLLKDLSTRDFGAAELERYSYQPYGVSLEATRIHRIHTGWALGDGQAFLTIAADPAAEGPALALDIPVYRMGRIGWSLVIRAIAWGDVDRMPFAVTVGGLLAYGSLAAVSLSLVPRWGYRMLLVPLIPGVLVGLVQGTSEVLAGVFALGALGATTARWAAMSGLALGITRADFATVVPAARRPSPAVAGAAFGAVALQLFLIAGLGLQRMGITEAPLDLPGFGYLNALAATDGSPTAVINTSIGVLLLAALVARMVSTARSVPLYAFACGATALLVACLPELAVAQEDSYLRVTAAAMIFLVIPQPSRTGNFRLRPTPGSEAPHSESLESS
jgi:hypothetical protein